MKVRKSYLVVFNHITNEVCLSRINSNYDKVIQNNTLGLL